MRLCSEVEVLVVEVLVLREVVLRSTERGLEEEAEMGSSHEGRVNKTLGILDNDLY